MKTIYKYQGQAFSNENLVIYTFPKGSQILRVDYVDDVFYKGYFLWAVVDTTVTETSLYP